MARKPKVTGAREVESLLRKGKPSQHTAGDGLYLKVSGPGRGSWVFRYKVNGRTRRMGLGSVSVITLVQARKWAKEQKNC